MPGIKIVGRVFRPGPGLYLSPQSGRAVWATVNFIYFRSAGPPAAQHRTEDAGSRKQRSAASGGPPVCSLHGAKCCSRCRSAAVQQCRFPPTRRLQGVGPARRDIPFPVGICDGIVRLLLLCQAGGPARRTSQEDQPGGPARRTSQGGGLRGRLRSCRDPDRCHAAARAVRTTVSYSRLHMYEGETLGRRHMDWPASPRPSEAPTPISPPNSNSQPPAAHFHPSTSIPPLLFGRTAQTSSAPPAGSWQGSAPVNGAVPWPSQSAPPGQPPARHDDGEM
jgi:hypothetical protein